MNLEETDQVDKAQATLTLGIISNSRRTGSSNENKAKVGDGENKSGHKGRNIKILKKIATADNV